MSPSVATLVAAVATGASLVAAALAALMTRGPGWAHLRWYALAALFAAGFTATDVVLTVGGTQAQLDWAARVNLSVLGLHGACWFCFFAAWEGRPLRPLDHAFVWPAVGLGLLALWPGAFSRPPFVARRLEGLGITYHDGQLTWLGLAFGAFSFVGILVLVWRASRLRGKRPGWAALLVGYVLLAVATVNDVLSALRVTSLPHLLDTALFALPFLVGGAVTTGLARDARQLVETRTELVRTERLAALGELAAVVAHEVRNPLGVIFNVLSSLRRSSNSTETAELLGMAEEESDRLRRLVASLLDFVRPFEPRQQWHPLGEILESAAEGATVFLKRSRAEVRLEVPDRCEVFADRDLLRQAVVNLLENALEVPGRVGPAVVRVEQREEGLLVAVVDDGVGVPEADRPKLFTPFFTTRPKGNGLGLAFVRRVVEAHGGTVSYAPGVPRGSVFSATLPPGSQPGQSSTP